MKWKLSLLLLLVGILGLFIYSYTQIDLNLTLSSNQIYQQLQQQLIFIGYYNRLLSVIIFVSLYVVLSAGYLAAVRFVPKLINPRSFFILCAIPLLLLFAYPAFSHDLFNYMFDARVVTIYHLDPHFFKALDFPADAWTRFMHWTHRYYPYGPGWLLLTLVPSFVGSGKFVLTLLLYKLVFGAFHLSNIFLINKILRAHKPHIAVAGTLFFALNPLVLVESLVSPHNEVVMLFFALVGIYALLRHQAVTTILAILLSASIKYVSMLMLPLLLLWRGIISYGIINWIYYGWLAALVPFFLLREPYSWYFLPLVGLGALLFENRVIRILTLSLSLSALIRYAPFIGLGEYTVLQVQLQTWSMIATFSITTCLAWIIWHKHIPT